MMIFDLTVAKFICGHGAGDTRRIPPAVRALKSSKMRLYPAAAKCNIICCRRTRRRWTLPRLSNSSMTQRSFRILEHSLVAEHFPQCLIRFRVRHADDGALACAKSRRLDDDQDRIFRPLRQRIRPNVS